MKQGKDIAYLVARVVIGGVFVFAGWAKASEMASTVSFFSQMGLPAFVAYLVSYGEIVGGVLVMLGLWAELASIGLAIIMLGALWFTRALGAQGMMMPVAMIGGLAAIFSVGAGRWAVTLPKRAVTS